VKVEFEGARVRVESEGSYREVTLTRPEARNALDDTMRDELFEVLRAILGDDGAGSVALVAEGRDFCAGGDLAEFGRAIDPATAWQSRLARSLPLLLIRLRERLIAGVQGSAIGAGLELSAFASRLVAASDARFRLPELAFGLIPGAGGTVSVPRRIGRQRALELVLSGEWLDANAAQAQGLVDEVVAPAALLDRVRAIGGLA
jgi:enoyl-CoA hydratase/carnithine racemase